ncbi:MAG: methyltransferase domain-containing protein [Clostridia bacterium]
MNTIGNTSSSRYIRKIDYREPTADYKIANQVKDGSKVLEIGTSSGYMSEFLVKEKNCILSGVEYNTELFNKAKVFFENGYNEDLNKITQWEDKIQDNYFDYIICQDVLEHLLNPFEVIKALMKKLAKNGKILVSIPNVSHNAILMEILKDKFSYEQSGSLDYTHFKFYTAKSFKDEANKIGLKVIHHDITYLIPEDSSLNNSYKDYSLKEREVLFDHYNGHVFQNIFVLGKKEEYADEKEKLIQFKLQNYDEVIIETKSNVKRYYYHDAELIEYILEKGTQNVKIYPSIRLKKFNVDLYINDEKQYISSFDYQAGIIHENEDRYISTGTECINLKRDFKKGDKVGIRITSSESIFDQIIKGENYFNSEITNIKAKIDKYTHISIAAWDTFILKNVLKFDDIIEIVDRKVRTKFGINNFAKRRLAAKSYEIDEIYEELRIFLKDKTEDVKKIEIETVQEFSIVNPFMLEILDFCKRQNKNVYIVNNGYLDSNILMAVLHNLQITNLKVISYDDLLKFDLDQLLHIGSDIKKDIINLKSLNINTYMYKAVQKRVENRKSLETKNISESIMRAIQYNYIYNGLHIKYFEKFGIENVAPIYFYFTNWLYNKSKDKDNIFFLSRDGYMPFKVYKLLQKSRNTDKYIKYVYASRKGYQIPGLATVGIDKALSVLTEFNLQLDEQLILSDVFKNATLNPEEVSKQKLEKYGFKSIDAKVNIKNINKAKELLKEYYPKIKENLQNKLELAREYLKSEEFDKFDTVNIVDIGWRGSVQNYIQKIMNKKTYGYYFGTIPTEYKEIRKNMLGCYSNKFMPLLRSEFILDNIMMFELVFSAPFPPLVGFEKNSKGKVVPVFSSVKSDTFNKAVKTFQESALYIIEKFMDYDEYLSEIDIDFSLSNYKKYIADKKYADIIEMHKLQTNIGYGEKQRKYVETVKLETLLADNIKVLKKANYGFWKGAIYIEGVETQKEYDEIKKKYNFKTSLGAIKASRYYRGAEAMLNKKQKNK